MCSIQVFCSSSRRRDEESPTSPCELRSTSCDDHDGKRKRQRNARANCVVAVRRCLNGARRSSQLPAAHQALAELLLPSPLSARRAPCENPEILAGHFRI